MSIRNLQLVSFVAKLLRQNGKSVIRNFSRKSVNSDGTYKVVKPRKTKKQDTALAWRDPNYDILASKCFPFFMPGSIGPAWYDSYTTLKEDVVNLFDMDIEKNENITCKIQTCPQVLRHTVYDLFPSRNFDESVLSVVTLSIKPDLKLLRKNNEIETEKLAQLFVLGAKAVCSKLRRIGYWADFINPFSGKPYYTLIPNDELYTTDEKFRCLDFQIYEISECLIVSNEEDKTKRSFVGSLFTNAPSNKNDLNTIFTSNTTDVQDM